MPVCDQCRPQLLPYLYDLLEPAERIELEEHVRSCPACRSALEAMRGKRALLAEAVKESFPDISFSPPRPAPTPQPAPVAPRAPAPRPVAPRRPVLALVLNRWAIAAALLLAVFSGGIVIGGAAIQHQQAEVARAEEHWREADRVYRVAQAKLDEHRTDVQHKMQDIQHDIDKKLEQWQGDIVRQRRKVEKENLWFVFTGPRDVQAGAANDYDIEVRPTDANAPAPEFKQVLARIVNEKAEPPQVLLTRPLAGATPFKLHLPPDLAVRPGDNLTLVVEAQVAGQKPVQVKERLSLVFPEYVTHLTTDRPVYRPGDTVRFRSLTLDRFSLKPAGEVLSLRYRITNPAGTEIYRLIAASRLVEKDGKTAVAGPDGKALGGLGAGEFRLPKELAAGQYAISVGEANDRFPEERRTFVVHRREPARFVKEVKFDRAAYGPGDRVILRGKVQPLTVANNVNNVGLDQVQINAQGLADDQFFLNATRSADDDGGFQFEFSLPQHMPRGQGLVTLEFHQGGLSDSLVRAVPVLLREVLVDFYPEGGELIAGVPNRVYFQARLASNKPADVRGRIIELPVGALADPKEALAKAREVVRVQTLSDETEPGLNQGLGAFTFTPRPGFRYEMRIDAPVGISKRYALPQPKADGVALHVPQGVVDGDMPVRLTSAGRPRDLLVGVYCRGKLLDSAKVSAQTNKAVEAVLKPRANVGGVHRITVFQMEQGEYRPVAERLVFRRQAEKIEVGIETERITYEPADHVKLALRARNEKKEQVPAVALVAVLDAGMLRLADDRSTRSLPTHFLLTTEVRRPEDLENADALLGPHPKAAEALDLLLGSQGWRRFAEQDPVAFKRKQPPAARTPTFLSWSETGRKPSSSEERILAEVDGGHFKEFVKLQKELAEKEQQEAGPSSLQHEVQTLQNQTASANEMMRDQQRRLDGVRDLLFHSIGGAAMLAAVFLGFFLVNFGLHRLAEGRYGAPFLIGGLAFLAFLFFAGIVGTLTLMNSRTEFDRFGRAVFAPAMVKPAGPAFEPVQTRWSMPADDVDALNDWLEQRQAAESDSADSPRNDVPAPPNRPAMMPVPAAGPIGEPGMIFGPAAPAPGQGGIIDERALRQQGRYQELLQKRLGRRALVPPPDDGCAVRVYAHKHKADANAAGPDLADTLYWHPALVLPGGEGTVDFDLSDAPGRYRVIVVGHTADGRLGAGALDLTARVPFHIEPKTPVEVASSDQISVPVTVANKMAGDGKFQLTAAPRGLESVKTQADLLVPGQKIGRQIFHFKPAIQNGDAAIRFRGRVAGKGADTVERSIKVVPDGYLVTGFRSGMLQNEFQTEQEITLPDAWMDGTLEVQLRVYPSVLTELQAGLDALERAPLGGCEQTASAAALNALILNQLRQTNQANLPLEKRCRTLLESHYRGLLGFECGAPGGTKGGFDWFGGASPQVGLTAYSLLSLNEMAAVYPVDAALVKRTEAALAGRQDAPPGPAPRHVADAFACCALTEAGAGADIDQEMGALAAKAKDSGDSYFIALVGLAQLNRGQNGAALGLLRRLAELQKASGDLDGAETSITGSAGRDLAVETTALATLAWVRAKKPEQFQGNIDRGMSWLVEQRDGNGGFGATQATTLALRTLAAHARDGRKVVQPGDLTLTISNENGGPGAQEEAKLTGDAREPIVIKMSDRRTFQTAGPAAGGPGGGPGGPAGGGGIVQLLNPNQNRGKNRVQISSTAHNVLPYTLSWSYRLPKAEATADAPLRLTTKLARTQAKEGETVKLAAVVENKSGKTQPMAVAVLGLPAGLALPKDAKLPAGVDAWEVRGRELVLYWRQLDVGAKAEVNLDLVCRLPGARYRGPTSRAYPYYNAQRPALADPLQIAISPME